MTLDTEWLGHLDGNYDAATYKLSGLGKKKHLSEACFLANTMGVITAMRQGDCELSFHVNRVRSLTVQHCPTKPGSCCKALCRSLTWTEQ